VFDGFMPTYDFYGCCNDPTYGGTVDLDGTVHPNLSNTAEDHNFSDLICEPFKQSKDATRTFLQHIDFLRGDRVGFVTFARSAFIIDHDGTAGPLSPMLDNFSDAVDTLNKDVGVRAEPNFYQWNTTGGGWTGFAQGVDPVSGTSIAANYDDTTIAGLNLHDYPVSSDCPYQDAGLGFPLTRLIPYTVTNGQPAPAAPPADQPPIMRIMTPPNPSPTNVGSAAAWAAGGVTLGPSTSYEVWASCRDSNIGSGLREANNALLNPNTLRRSGTVWVMVLMSDGAAGASDPVRTNRVVPTTPNPYQRQNPAQPLSPTNLYGVRGSYGAYGVCPYGTPSKKGELTDIGNEPVKVIFPYCSDEIPESRHFCSFRPALARDNNPADATHDVNYDPSQTFQWNVTHGHVYDVDIADWGTGDQSDCQYYDVDDYARDWADFVGIAPEGVSDAQLPTIFTIGFGINFNVNRSGNTPGGCFDYNSSSGASNVENCLGEELLRYIADIGDNNEVDVDYEQDWLDNHQIDGKLINGKSFAGRGPCEDPAGSTPDPVNGYPNFNAEVSRLAPTKDCGNYFNAPDQTRLNQVFNEIASRMFTRISG
jgi:hypothetical protein